jgi:hypothetical protein
MLAKWPPLKLAQLALAGALLSLSRMLAPPLILVAMRLRGWLIGPQASSRIELAYYGFSLVLFLIPSLIGSVVLALAKRRIDEGLEKKRWTEQETELALGWIDSPTVKRSVRTVAMAMLGGFLVCLFPLHGHRSDAFRLALDLVVLLSVLPSPKGSLAQIRKSLSPEPPPHDPSKWTSTYKPLHSEHWGGREIPKPERSEA